MKIKASAITAALLLAWTAQAANATEAVGYNVVTVPANSDVLVSVPFNNDVEETFTVESVSTSGVTVNEALSADTYDTGYYVRFIDGNGEGLWSTISANGDGGIELENTDIMNYVSAGDTFRIYAHHTLNSVMTSGLVDVAYDTDTSVLLFDNSIEGINKSSATVVTYYDTDTPVSRHGWYVGTIEKGSSVLDPESMFIVRNSGTRELSVIIAGTVPDYNVSMLLSAGGSLDMHLTAGFPVSVTVNDLGLEEKGDILLFDNSTIGINKSASIVATYYDTDVPVSRHGWYSGSTLVGTNSISTFVFRKVASDTIEKVTIAKPY